MLDVTQQLAPPLAMFLALLLGATGFHKLVRSARGARGAQELLRLSHPVARVAIFAAAFAELSAALLLGTHALRHAAAWIASLLLIAYTLLLLRALMGGRKGMECGCSFGAGHQPLGAGQLIRNALLLCVAVFAAVMPVAPAAQPAGSDWLAAIAMFVLYAAFDQTMNLQPMRAGESL